MKKFALVTLWLVASAAAVGVAWAGVSVVDDSVIDPSPAIDLTGSPATFESGSLTAPATTPTTASTGSSTTHRGTTATTQAAPSTATSSSTAPPTSSTTVPRSTTVPTSTVAPSSVTETYTLTGGTVAISFSSSGVSVLWATPNSGFDVTIEPESPGLKVEFRSSNHRSRVDAWWANGPQHSVREEAK